MNHAGNRLSGGRSTVVASRPDEEVIKSEHEELLKEEIKQEPKGNDSLHASDCDMFRAIHLCLICRQIYCISTFLFCFDIHVFFELC